MTHPVADGGLIVFLRLPRKGQVKTRLAESLGADKALDIYVQLVRRTIDTAGELHCPTYFFYEGGLPVESEQLSSAEYFLQTEGDLGQRMLNAFSFILKKHRKAVIIGSDCPGLTADIIKQAFASLDTHDIVLGPAVDGGYYLLGCKKADPHLFDDIQWSSQSVMQETIGRCNDAGLSYSLLTELRDVDTIEDYLLLRHEIDSK